MSCPRPNTPRSDAKSVAELAEPLKSRIWTVIQDAPTKGLVLVSGFRDPGRQWDLRHDRCPGRECDRACKGYPITAVPYASNHQKRTAADMGGRDLNWLIANRARYGLGLTVRSENWHFEASGTDTRTGLKIGNPTVRIIPYGDKPKPPEPPKETFLMSLTEKEQRELLSNSRTALEKLAAMPTRDFVLRDPDNASVWVIGSGGRWWVKTMEALNLLIWTGKVAGLGTDGIPVAQRVWLDSIPIIATPDDVEQFETPDAPPGA